MAEVEIEENCSGEERERETIIDPDIAHVKSSGEPEHHRHPNEYICYQGDPKEWFCIAGASQAIGESELCGISKLI